MASATSEPSRLAEITAAAIFVLLTGGFVGVTLTYPPTDRLLPLVVGVPTFLLSVVILASYFSPELSAAVDRFEFRALDTDGEFAADEPGLSSNPYLEPIAWVLLLFGAGILFGLAVVAPVYIYLFITRYGGKSRRAAAAVGIGATAVFVLLFEVVLGTSLYGGLVTEFVLGVIR